MSKRCGYCERAFDSEGNPPVEFRKPFLTGYDNIALKNMFDELVYLLCSACCKKTFTKCRAKDCDYLVAKHHITRFGGYCCVCSSSDTILAYNYNPCTKLKNFYNEFGAVAPGAAMAEKDMYLGVELEVVINPEHTTRKVAEETQDAMGSLFAVLKYDGSINCGRRRGFEIVSAPATLEFQKRAWKNFFEFAEETNYFTALHPSCGMHVHMSRSALNPQIVAKMVKFIYGSYNQDFIKKIAQRKPNNYCDYSPESALNTKNHYTALNRSKKETVELRIFQSIVDFELFSKNIEFCHAMYVYTRELSTRKSSDSDLAFEKFISYAKDSKDAYPNLNKYLDTLWCTEKKAIKESSLILESAF